MPAPRPARAIDRPAALGALLLVATVTEAMFLLLPSFVGALGDDLQLSTTRTGLLASADLTGIALMTATAPWWLRRVSWRRTVLTSHTAFLLLLPVSIVHAGHDPSFGRERLQSLARAYLDARPAVSSPP